MGPGDPPAAPVHEFFVQPPARFELTKVLRSENYLQGILGANEPPLNGAQFVVPNVVAFQESPSGAESRMRWHVPVDDNSHVEFIIRYLGEVPITGDPVGAAHRVLLKAMEEVALSGESRRDQP